MDDGERFLVLIGNPCGRTHAKPLVVGAGRSWERSKGGVPLRIHLDAVMAEKRLSNRATVRGERPRVGLRAELMQQLG